MKGKLRSLLRQSIRLCLGCLGPALLLVLPGLGFTLCLVSHLLGLAVQRCPATGPHFVTEETGDGGK